MIKSRFCDLTGLKYPIVQAGMGPFATTELCIAAANAGCLGLMSTAAPNPSTKKNWFKIYQEYVRSAHAEETDDAVTIFKKMFIRVFNETKESQGIFGVNVMVSEEMVANAENVVQAMIEVRNENPEMKKRFRVLLTSAGNPKPWAKVAKENDLVWMHVLPSVKAAMTCKKAGVDVVVASGHEAGFHTAWEPVHSMILLPAVIEAMEAEDGIDNHPLVLGTGGYCDGKTLAAAMVMGADGVQMGTRFLATQESDFNQMWKDNVVACQDRGTIVARGFVGPARWLKNDRSMLHVQNCIKGSPGVFTGIPDDLDTVDPKLIEFEYASINAVYDGDTEKAMMAAGECAQRINDLPKVNDMVQKVVTEAEAILKGSCNLVG